MQFQDWMFDIRVVDRNIRRGNITRADYERFVKNLVDVSDNVACDEADEEDAESHEAE